MKYLFGFDYLLWGADENEVQQPLALAWPPRLHVQTARGYFLSLTDEQKKAYIKIEKDFHNPRWVKRVYIGEQLENFAILPSECTQVDADLETAFRIFIAIALAIKIQTIQSTLLAKRMTIAA